MIYWITVALDGYLVFNSGFNHAILLHLVLQDDGVKSMLERDVYWRGRFANVLTVNVSTVLDLLDTVCELTNSPFSSTNSSSLLIGVTALVSENEPDEATVGRAD